MSKKDKKIPQKSNQGEASLPQTPIISRRGWKLIGAGVFIVTVGFVVLSFTDPRGQNWASTLSPFLLVGGYSLIGIGIITPDPS